MKIYLHNYKDRIIDLWAKYNNLAVFNEFGCDYRRSPLLPEYVLNNSMMFIGVNPSFTKKSIINEENKIIEYYPIQDRDIKDLPYFEKFKEISDYCNSIPYSHLDLLFFRETNQNVVKGLCKNAVPFIEEQLSITFEIIEKANPRIIVVANSLATEFFGKLKRKHMPRFTKIWRGFDLDFEKDFDSKLGTYKVLIGGKSIPVIFSGMLSGQRALDIGSLERLKWQIKRILEIEAA